MARKESEQRPADQPAEVVQAAAAPDVAMAGFTAPRHSPAPAAEAEASIYVGPGIAGKLATYTLFKGGELMPHIQAMADEHRAIKSLIVPVSQLGETLKRLSDPASVEALRYNEARQINRKGVTE